MSDVAVDATPSIENGIMAMTDNDGVVVTLYQSDEEHGAVVRHGGAWIPLTDPETLEDLAFVGVQASAVDLYDKHEADQNLIPIKFYTPSADGPYWPDAIPLTDEELVEDVDEDSTEEPETEEESVTASVTIESADDLTAAIEAAERDPDLRWYVERRVASLGLEADLPWLKG